jgi:RNA polymerase sigma-70 factor (ECF subfamily)
MMRGAGRPRAEPGRSIGEPSDEELARRVQDGEREALEQLVRRYLRPIHAVTASYLAEQADVEDAAQETFLRAIEGIAGYQPTRPFAPWLYQIARNVARDRLAANARGRMDPLPLGEVESPGPDPELAMEHTEIRQLVEAAIGDLPEQQRTAFRLHDVEGYETSEIARIMGLTAGTIRSHVHYARRALRVALASRLGEPKNARG